MKTSLSSILFILAGLAVISSAVFGVFTPNAGNPAPADASDPDFSTLAEYSAGEVQAGYAPIAQPVHSTTGAPTLPAANPAARAEAQLAATATLTTQPVEIPDNLIPDRIVIEKIGLDAPVIPAGLRVVKGYEQDYNQWLAPDEFAAGWQGDSATLGKPGNTVLNGHHNVYGEVFKGLKDLQSGDLITVYSGSWQFTYTVANTMILPEKNQKLALRLENAQWIERSTDERLTLVTCWPPDNNTHRVIIVAVPVGHQYLP